MIIKCKIIKVYLKQTKLLNSKVLIGCSFHNKPIFYNIWIYFIDYLFLHFFWENEEIINSKFYSAKQD